MVLLKQTYTRMQRMGHALTTAALVLVGLFVLFFTPSTTFPADHPLGDIDIGVAHAEVPGDSATTCDSCGCGCDCG